MQPAFRWLRLQGKTSCRDGLLNWSQHTHCWWPHTPAQIAYAESTGDCRRSLLMHHFGEHGFGPEQCANTCDVCQSLAAGGKQVRRRLAAVVRYPLV